MSAVAPPVCAAPALASGGSLPADLTGYSVEPVKASSAECPADDLDVTLWALARQLVSSSVVVPHGGEGYPPLLELLSEKAGSGKGLPKGLVESSGNRLLDSLVSYLASVGLLVHGDRLQYPSVVSILFVWGSHFWLFVSSVALVVG